jgi:hypothetical protein
MNQDFLVSSIEHCLYYWSDRRFVWSIAVDVERSGFAMEPPDRALVLSDSMPLKLLVEPFGQMERVGKGALLPFVDSFSDLKKGALSTTAWLETSRRLSL